MTHVALTVIAPVTAGRREALAAALDGLPTGSGSPLAGIPGLHVGRLTIIDHLEEPRARRAAVHGPFLLFAVDADGPQEALLPAIAASCGGLFGACDGCPDPADLAAFSRWLLRHRVRDRWTIMPYAQRTLHEVRAAVALREQLGSFAVRADGLEATALRRAFLEQFDGDRSPAGSEA